MIKKLNIREELEEALLIYEKPSRYFISLKEDNNLEMEFPEISDLVDIIQSPIHHPEGNVFNHTMMVVDEAAKLRNKAKNPIGFMYSALCHDLGKVITTRVKEDGKIISYNHERAGLKLVRKFLNRIIRKEENEFRDYVLNMVEFHMQPNQLANQNSSLKSTRRLFKKSVCPHDLILLAKADALGRSIGEDYSIKEAYLKNALKDFQKLKQL